MNDLQALRETLHDHADLHDTASTTRAGAVHDRVRGVRRRRRAVVGGVAVSAVAALAIGLNLPSNDRPEPANSGGLDAPSTITSLGYTYQLESTTTHEHRVSVKVPKSDQPTLVAWGTAAGADDPVRVDARDGEPFTSADDAFKDFYVVDPGEGATISVAGAEGKLSVATYSLGDNPPPGVTKDGITFRDEVADWSLVAAAIGDRGAHELSFDVTIPSDGLVRLADLCLGLPKGYWVNLAVDGKALEFSDHDSCDDTGFDPAEGSYSVTRWSTFGEPGETVPVRLWVSRTLGGEEAVDAADLADLRLGYAFYEARNRDADADGGDLIPDEVIESGGHTWRATQTFTVFGTEDAEQAVDSPGPHLVVVGPSHRVDGSPRRGSGSFSTDHTFSTDAGKVYDFRPDEAGLGLLQMMMPRDATILKVHSGPRGSEDARTFISIYDRSD